MKYLLALVLIAIVAISSCEETPKWAYYEVVYEDQVRDTLLLDRRNSYELKMERTGEIILTDGYDNIIAIKVRRFRLLTLKSETQKELKLKQPLKNEKSSSSGNQKLKERDSITKTR